MNWRERVAALLGVSAYAAPPSNLPTLDDKRVRRLRKSFGGQISPLPQTQTRWLLADLEAAISAADTGDISSAARLWRAMRRDGVLAGVMSTRAGGLVHLPKKFDGAVEAKNILEGRDGARSVFDAMHPPQELECMAADGIALGVAVGELVPVEGRDYPVLVRLDPEWLRYRWTENRWYYLSIAGQIPITPGDGRWVLHLPGGRVSPWQSGIWGALGQAWIDKQHARLHKANWEAKLANPARVAVSPQGAAEAQKQAWFRQVMAWGVNTVFGMTPGYDVKLVESNGRGYESFDTTITRSEREYMVAIAGQVVTTDGGTGFANADIHKSIRADLIKSTAEALAFTLNTQTIPSFIVDRFGPDALDTAPVVAWDTTPPKDLKADADATEALGRGIISANAALAPYEQRVDAVEIASRYGLPLKAGAAEPVLPSDKEEPAIAPLLDQEAA